MAPVRRPRIRRIPVTPPRTPARPLPPVTPPPLRDGYRAEESGIRLRIDRQSHDDAIDVAITED